MEHELEHLENEGWHWLCAASGSEPWAPYGITDLLQVSAGHAATALVYGGIAPRDEAQRRLPPFTPTPVPNATTSA